MIADLFDEKEKKILELESRKRVYEVVKKFAGCHFREIERKSSLPTGTVKYHLSYLAKHDLIKEDKDENNIRYFPKEFKLENKKIMILLRQKKIREIILCILLYPDYNHEQISQMVKVSPSTVSWHLKKLEEDKVISYIKKGRKKFYSILIDKDEIVKLLIVYKESFLDSLVNRVIEMWEMN